MLPHSFPRFCRLRLGLAVALALGALARTAAAQSITGTGDLRPGAPVTPVWNVVGDLSVGRTGTATLVIDGGAVVTSTGAGYIGYDGNANGSVTLRGVGSALNTGDAFYVGRYGAGQLSVTGGASVLSGGHSYIGLYGGIAGSATISGAGSTWRSVGEMMVGVQMATGELFILDGAKVHSAGGRLGDGFLSSGKVTVAGTGSSWRSTSDLYIGRNELGVLDIRDGGEVLVGVQAGGAAGSVRIAGDRLAVGTLNIGAASGGAAASAGVLRVNDLLFGQGTGTIVFNHTGLPDGTGLDFGAAIRGRGTLLHENGATMLSGDSALFRGITKVSGGTLSLAGRLGGEVAVSGAGALTGSGVATGNVSVGPGGALLGRQGQTLAIGGNLVLDAGSRVTAALGGGAAPALFQVGGNLTLSGGTLDVVDQGGFGAGVYRLFDYAGALTGPGLTLGATPTGVARDRLDIQTSIIGRVNLVSSHGAALSFWDGSLGTLPGNGRVDGGSGAWTASGRNWTTVDGAINGAWSSTPAYAIFQGPAGTVTVDDRAGAPAVTGMQFDSDGYRLEGGAIALQGPGGESLIRVGDGTAAGAGMTATIATTLTGASRLVKSDHGTLVLQGANTYTGGTQVRGGTLVGDVRSLPGDIAVDAAATLVFDQAPDGRYGGRLSGAGQVIKQGAGTLVLDGDSAGFRGHTTLAGGILRLGDTASPGRLGGSLSISASGLLGGVGTVGSGNGTRVSIGNGGTLAPGNSVGTLSVDGKLVFEPGSRYVVEVDPTGAASDRVDVSGDVVIQGGAVTHVGADGNYRPLAVYTILSTRGALSGQFDSVTSDFAFLRPSLGYDYGKGTVDLRLLRNDVAFGAMAATANQAAVAHALDRMDLAAGSGVAEAVARLPADRERIRAAFDQLSGELHGSIQSALLEDSRYLREAANARLLALSDSADAVMAAADEGATLWGSGFGGWSRVDGDGNAAGRAQATRGFLFGIDRPVAGTARLGLLAGYSRGSITVADRDSRATSDNYHLGLYGGASRGNLRARGGLAYTWHDLDTRRSVALPGLSNTLKSGYRAGSMQAFGELGYRVDLAPVALEPYVSLAHIRLATEGYAERGGAAALRAGRQRADLSYATLGLRAVTGLELGAVDAQLRGMLGWRRAFGDTTPLSRQGYSVGEVFSVAGAAIVRDAAVIEVGLDALLSRSATLGLAYGGQFASGARQHGVKAELAWRF